MTGHASSRKVIFAALAIGGILALAATTRGGAGARAEHSWRPASPIPPRSAVHGNVR